MVLARTLLAAAAWLSAAQASYLNNELSFGQTNRISTDLRSIPGFQLQGKPDPPQILSNKVILTPPAPGNQRGAVWAEKTLDYAAWTVDLDFRTTGPERGSGNIQVWLASRGKDEVGTASVYTVGKFEGLAIVIDQYAGSAGFIRGFLNDGSTDYKSHHSVDSLAFGHCEYSYRNLGRPSRLAVRFTPDNFRVDIDGHLCFESPKVMLPGGYTLGVTAASAENADSFEVFKLVTTTESMTPDAETHGPGKKQTDGNAKADSKAESKKGPIPVAKKPWGSSSSSTEDPADEPASSIPESAQFADLHDRLQAMMKHISALNNELSTSQKTHQTRLSSLDEKLGRLEQSLAKLEAMDKKLADVQSDVRQTKSDLHNALDRQVAGLKSVVRDGHQSIVGAAPGIMGYILVAMAGQAVTVAAYLVYKRRKNAGPKKYL